MRRRDDRTPEERAQYEAGAITPEEAALDGLTVEEANKLRDETEWALGNLLAPPPPHD